jgi:hypothetical protein
MSRSNRRKTTAAAAVSRSSDAKSPRVQGRHHDFFGVGFLLNLLSL